MQVRSCLKVFLKSSDESIWYFKRKKRVWHHQGVPRLLIHPAQVGRKKTIKSDGKKNFFCNKMIILCWPQASRGLLLWQRVCFFHQNFSADQNSGFSRKKKYIFYFFWNFGEKKTTLCHNSRPRLAWGQQRIIFLLQKKDFKNTFKQDLTCMKKAQ